MKVTAPAHTLATVTTVRLRDIHDRLLQNAFLRQNAIFFFGSLIVSILNYAYYPVIGRMLNLEQYGEVQVLISFFLQLSLLLIVLSQVTVNVVANYADPKEKNRVIFELEKFAVLASTIILCIGVALSWKVSTALKFESPVPFIILLIAFMSAIPFTFRSAYLRGKGKFGQVSIGNILVAAGKLVGAVGLVAAGLGVSGAIGGLIAAQLLALIYTVSRTRKLAFVRPASSSYLSKPDFKLLAPELKYTSFVLGISLGVTFLSSIDVIAVKYFFDAQTAGGYAGIATVAKIIFFLTASIAQVMLPSVKLRQPSSENRRFLIKSFLILAALGGGTWVVFALLPKFVVGTLMGSAFTPYSHLLPMLALALFNVSVINLIVSYYMALRRYQIILIMLTGVLLTLFLLSARHANLTSVVQSMVLATGGTLGMLAVWRALLLVRARSTS